MIFQVLDWQDLCVCLAMFSAGINGTYLPANDGLGEESVIYSTATFSYGANVHEIVKMHKQL